MQLRCRALRFRRKRILRLHKGCSTFPEDKADNQRVLSHCPLTLSGPHIWRCKRACHLIIRLTGLLLDTESVGFSRADGDQASMSKKCISRTEPKSTANVGDDFLADGAFLETRPKNKDVLA
jgi:hypothetical protein